MFDRCWETFAHAHGSSIVNRWGTARLPLACSCLPLQGIGDRRLSGVSVSDSRWDIVEWDYRGEMRIESTLQKIPIRFIPFISILGVILFALAAKANPA